MPANFIPGLIAFIFMLLTLFVPEKPKVMTYARMVVDTLSSPSMHGRGYVKEGHLKAATFIAAEFKRLGLQSFGNAYFQEFDVSVNTFPSRVELSAGDSMLAAGKDFLVAPCTQSIKGTFSTISLEKEEILDSKLLLQKLQEARGKVLVIDQEMFGKTNSEEQKKLNETLTFLKQFKNNPAEAVILLTTEKLTWHMAQEPCETPQLIVRKEVFPSPFQSVELQIKNKFIKRQQTQNVVGLVKGKSQDKGVLLVSAHYDHLGRLGENAYFPGANDNASGVAMMLSLARHFSKAENQPEQDILFIAFGAEELGLLGAQHFVKNPLVPLEKIGFMINLDITGTGEEGIKVVNGSVFMEEFERLQKINESHDLLPKVSPRGEACNSDHCLFYNAGIPSFYIYTLGGIQAYHDVHDKAATLPLTEFEDLYKLLQLFIKEV